MKHFLLSLFVTTFLVGCSANPKDSANGPKTVSTKNTTVAKDETPSSESEDVDQKSIVKEFKNIRPHHAIKTSVAVAYGKNPGTKTDKILHKRDISEILDQNYVLAELFIASADSASTINNLGNAALLVTAVAVAGAQAETVVRTNRLLAGLFFSEGLRFVSPRKAGNAFRNAASEALCFNKKTFTSKNITENDGALTDPGPRFKAELLYAMQVSHGNLRIRMVRPQANLISLVTNFSDKKSEVKEAEIVLANELDVAIADAAIEEEQKLVNLLKESKIDNATEKMSAAKKKVEYLTYRKELLECLK